jgi:hypothetical protein
MHCAAAAILDAHGGLRHLVGYRLEMVQALQNLHGMPRNTIFIAHLPRTGHRPLRQRASRA